MIVKEAYCKNFMLNLMFFVFRTFALFVLIINQYYLSEMKLYPIPLQNRKRFYKSCDVRLVFAIMDF